MATFIIYGYIQESLTNLRNLWLILGIYGYIYLSFANFRNL